MMHDVLKELSRGTSEIINLEGLQQKLEESRRKKRPLNVKVGFDPTAPDIHLGHVVLLRKIRQFQNLGHQIFFLIGDFTARIGDPSGRDQTRPKMDNRQIDENAKTYKAQVFKILDPERTKVVFNRDWLGKLKAENILELAKHSTVAQMLARADFRKRFEAKQEISLLEFLYPLLQGYDSVHLKADIELGGGDQKFNLLMGRQIQEAYGQSPQIVVTTPLLEGTDGVNKMSKSLDNYIGINEPASEIFGKVMSISDELMYRYYDLLTDHDLTAVKSQHPKEAKLDLAQALTAQFHPKGLAVKARANFEKTFSQHTIPDDIPEYRFSAVENIDLADILVAAQLAASKNEVRRLLKEGAIRHEGRKIETEAWRVQEGILKVGKRRFLRLIRNP